MGICSDKPFQADGRRAMQFLRVLMTSLAVMWPGDVPDCMLWSVQQMPCLSNDAIGLSIKHHESIMLTMQCNHAYQAMNRTIVCPVEDYK